MKAKKRFGILLTAVLLLTGCGTAGRGTSSTGTESAEGAYHKITAEEAKNKMDQEDVVIVDVRTEEEYEEAHIPGALLLPLDTIESQAAETLPDQDAVVLVYCRSGKRSKQAADMLVELGYANVFDFGGILDWPYETEGAAQ